MVDIRAEKEKFYAKLAEKGLKSTIQREAILDAFLKSKEHVSIEGLLALVRKKNSRIGYATVYRTLKLLTECDIACERDFGDGQTRFEHVKGGGHHDHLICVKCWGITEFENQKIESLQGVTVYPGKQFVTPLSNGQPNEASQLLNGAQWFGLCIGIPHVYRSLT